LGDQPIRTALGRPGALRREYEEVLRFFLREPEIPKDIPRGRVTLTGLFFAMPLPSDEGRTVAFLRERGAME
jgi:hypothetical protein